VNRLLFLHNRGLLASELEIELHFTVVYSSPIGGLRGGLLHVDMEDAKQAKLGLGGSI
jgi:hypothetical protein